MCGCCYNCCLCCLRRVALLPPSRQLFLQLARDECNNEGGWSAVAEKRDCWFGVAGENGDLAIKVISEEVIGTAATVVPQTVKGLPTGVLGIILEGSAEF